VRCWGRCRVHMQPVRGIHGGVARRRRVGGGRHERRQRRLLVGGHGVHRARCHDGGHGGGVLGERVVGWALGHLRCCWDGQHRALGRHVGPARRRKGGGVGEGIPRPQQQKRPAGHATASCQGQLRGCLQPCTRASGGAWRTWQACPEGGPARRRTQAAGAAAGSACEVRPGAAAAAAAAAAGAAVAALEAAPGLAGAASPPLVRARGRRGRASA